MVWSNPSFSGGTRGAYSPPEFSPVKLYKPPRPSRITGVRKPNFVDFAPPGLRGNLPPGLGGPLPPGQAKKPPFMDFAPGARKKPPFMDFAPGAQGFDIATQNMGHGRKQADLRKLIADRPEIINLQQLRGKRLLAAKRQLVAQGYGIRGKGGVPIAWDKNALKLERFGHKGLTPATFVGAAGAGPSTLKAKRANFGVFKDRETGKRVTSTNAHLAPSIFLPQRKQLHTTQVRRIAALQAQLNKEYPHAKRLLGIDANTSKRRNLRPIMRQGGMQAYRAPGKTHRVGFIDWLMSNKSLKNQAMQNYGSDHNARLGRF